MISPRTPSPEAQHASAVRAGISHFDQCGDIDANPYADPECAKHFRMGFEARRDAQARWDEQRNTVDRELTKAEGFLNAGSQSGKLRIADRLRLLFLMLGSTDPDKAFTNFQASMTIARDRYRQGFYADPFGEPRERQA